MKKIVILIILLSLCMSSCKTHKTGTDATVNAAIQQEFAFTDFFDIDEYSEFISTTDRLPDDFVPYDKLDILGTFSGVVLWHNFTTGQFYAYMYGFIDSNGFHYSLYVTHGAEPYILDRPIYDIGEEMKSMIDPPADGQCAIIKNEKYYIYNNNALTSIKWQENNINYSIAVCNADKSPNYPLDGETTFLTRVFSLDDEVSGAAFAELSASLNS